MIRLMLVTLLAVLLAGCAKPIPSPQLEKVVPGSVSVTPSFSSELNNPFFVTAGPFDAYSRFPVNTWLQDGLEQWAADKSGGGKVITVDVHVTRLTTDYEGIGQIQPSVLSSRNHEPPDLPEQAIKSADMTFRLVLRSGETLLFDEVVEARYEQRLEYSIVMTYMIYNDQVKDYAPVMTGIVLEALRQIDKRFDTVTTSSGG